MAIKPWKGAFPPFRIFGNLYFVGTKPSSTHIIDTGDGLILIDPGYCENFYLVINNIWELGFNPKDIKYILLSHCHFDHIAYSAIRLGYYSVEGETIIENCYFKDVIRNRCIMFTAKNETLQECQVSLVVRGCIFDDTSALRFTKSSTVANSNLYVYANTWRQIPTSIDDATYYDVREQKEIGQN